MATEKEVELLAAHLEEKIMTLHGTALLTGKSLSNCLGYRSTEALRQAIVRKTVPVKVFSIKSRRGKFALAKDVAFWLAKQRLMNETPENNEVNQ